MSPGWVGLLEVLEEQIKTRQHALCQPARTEEKQYEAEFIKGEIAGMRLFAKIPSLRVELAERDIQDETEEGEVDHEQTSNVPTDEFDGWRRI